MKSDQKYNRISRTSMFIQSNRSVLIAAAAILSLTFYMNWAWLLQKQQEVSVQKGLDETLKLLLDIKESFKHEQQQPANQPQIDGSSVTKNKDQFSVADRGFWQGLGATKVHVFDEPLATALIQFFKSEQVTSLLELGSGTGAYAKKMKAEGIFLSCYDGNPETQDLSEGRCGVIDLSKPLDLCKYDWVLSFEVGEHIPKQFEDVFISNLDAGNKRGIVLSWAIEGQGGTSHVNLRNNTYIREQLSKRGYNSDFEAEKTLRNAATYGWFKNTIMVFRRQ